MKVAVIVLFACLFLIPSFVSAGDDFKKHCDNSGCYIASCGVQVSDISYIINTPGSPSCTWSEPYCDGNSIKQDIDGGRKSDLPFSAHPKCRQSSWPTSCSYVIETCSNGCTELSSGPTCCVPKTCDDFAAMGVCGSDLDAGCGVTLDCSAPRPNGATCQNNTFVCSDPDFANCNGDWLDGCEIDLTTDTNNCGSCNNMCADRFLCIAGSCQGNEWHDFTGSIVHHVDVGDYVRLQSPYIGTGATYTIMDGETVVHSDYAFDYYHVVAEPVSGLRFKINGVTNEFSNNLTASIGPGGGPDKPFIINILSPPCGEAYNMGTNLSVQVMALDADDLIYGSITIGGFVFPFNNIISSNVSFPYALLEQGNFQILVEANNTRNKQYRALSNIMIYNSYNTSVQYYVAACIDEPSNFDIFASSAVFFNATSSKGLEYTGSGGATGGTFNWIHPDDLLFDWTFVYNGRSTPGRCAGIGYEPCPGDVTPGATKYLFTKIFPTVNDNYAYLTVSF